MNDHKLSLNIQIQSRPHCPLSPLQESMPFNPIHHSLNKSSSITPVSPVHRHSLNDDNKLLKIDTTAIYKSELHAHYSPNSAMDALSTVAFLLTHDEAPTQDVGNDDEPLSEHIKLLLSQRTPAPAQIQANRLEFILARNPLSTRIYMTYIDNVPVFITWFGLTDLCSILPNDFQEKLTDRGLLPGSCVSIPKQAIPLMRRVDNDMVNATLLLHAGAIETEQEKSIILSLEKKKVKYVRDPSSMLFGTWIPLGRATELARSFSVDTVLDLFLSKKLEKCFVKYENQRDTRPPEKAKTIDPKKLSIKSSLDRSRSLPFMGYFANDTAIQFQLRRIKTEENTRRLRENTTSSEPRSSLSSVAIVPKSKALKKKRAAKISSKNQTNMPAGDDTETEEDREDTKVASQTAIIPTLITTDLLVTKVSPIVNSAKLELNSTLISSKRTTPSTPPPIAEIQPRPKRSKK